MPTMWDAQTSLYILNHAAEINPALSIHRQAMLRSNRNSADSSSTSMRASFFSPDACSRDFLIVLVPRIQTANALLVQNSLTVEETFEILAELKAKFDLNSQMSQPMRRETLRSVFRNAGMTLYVTSQRSTFCAMRMINIQGPGVTAIEAAIPVGFQSNVILILTYYTHLGPFWSQDKI